MKPAGVQPKKGNVETGRAFFTKSGLKRNKKFATISPMTVEEQETAMGKKVPKVEVVADVASDWQEDAGFDEEMDEKFTSAIRKLSAPTSSRSTATSTSTTPGPSPMMAHRYSSSSPLDRPRVSSTSTNTNYHDILEMFIREEMKLGERRRLLYSEGDVGTLLGQNKHCPFKSSDIKPLVFHDYRLTIKTHIMLVYEWLQSWPELQELDDFDRMSILRKCVLIHFLLDPSFLSYQIGEPDKLIMQNGGFISTADHHNGVGWEDEEDISGENKRKYYVPMMKHITDEIMPAMHAMRITFEEFVALKTLASFQGGELIGIFGICAHLLWDHLI
uniref:NR LBD domain-containing protein n=1 Tax=Caenorhabditis japonica TaxID=281687 RepID=A0A8R1DUV7_CAEJA